MISAAPEALYVSADTPESLDLFDMLVRRESFVPDDEIVRNGILSLPVQRAVFAVALEHQRLLYGRAEIELDGRIDPTPDPLAREWLFSAGIATEDERLLLEAVS